MTQFEQLDLLLNEYGGIIQTFQVIDNGISKPVFYSYVKERGLDQAAHRLLFSVEQEVSFNSYLGGLSIAIIFNA
ncbi:type IV toxin-antitoxin system AbiEi family antitoxin domain-containing protein [Agathobacter rectalis]|uniref:Uncharacterized protein n=1 Tax=Agathobacter rectalis TaxID=39491 RepID=A0A173VTK3_9FIRM|nr:type IV toxin-antitoxin system AbiEi family antitoxin domain-containing protein [Agathobacter rectalis]CUN29966.1 Uncharacterised protein [Agathobacter rectalis]